MREIAKLRAAIGAAALLGVGCMARAQPVETLTFSVVWDKPEIAHGETNTGKLLATVGPVLGTQTQWNTPPGKGQAGVLMAFASAVYNFKGVENGLNGLFSWTIPTEFNVSNIPGWSWPTGGTGPVFVGQVAPPINPNPNIGQSVTVLSFAWKEATGGGPYNVMFETEMLAAKVFLDIGTTTPIWVGENAVKIDGQGGFTVIPAPSAWALIAASVCVAARRRRSEA